jgi:hypothetical protein
MARIRTIKPEFPQSESMGRVSREARLLFIMLWTIADDFGRARAASPLLASLLYPYDDDASKHMDSWLDELEKEGCVRRYELNGSRYLDIPQWRKHQKIDNASKRSLVPEHPDGPAPAASRTVLPCLARLSDSSVCDSDSIDRDTETLDLDLGSRTRDLGSRTGRAVARSTGGRTKFDEFWEAYPKRQGRDPKAPSKKKFDAAVASGVDPDAIIRAARSYREQLEASGKLGTQYVARAVTWLTDHSWEDYQPRPAPAADHGEPMVEDARWLPIKSRLRAALGTHVVSTWFKGASILAIEADAVHLAFPSKFLKSWVESHFGDRVLACWREEDASIERILFTVAS